MATSTDSSVSEPCCGFVIVNAKTAGTNSPMTARTSSAAFDAAIFGLNCCVPWRRPPISTLAPSTSSRLPMIEPVIDALTTSMSPACSAKNAMISSAMLPNVALRMPPTCGPVSEPEALRREAHDPGEPEDRGGRRDEHDRLVGVEAEIQDDGDDADHQRDRAGTPGRTARAGRGWAGRTRGPVRAPERRSQSRGHATESRGSRKAASGVVRNPRQPRGCTARGHGHPRRAVRVRVAVRRQDPHDRARLGEHAPVRARAGQAAVPPARDHVRIGHLDRAAGGRPVPGRRDVPARCSSPIRTSSPRR